MLDELKIYKNTYVFVVQLHDYVIVVLSHTYMYTIPTNEITTLRCLNHIHVHFLAGALRQTL